MFLIGVGTSALVTLIYSLTRLKLLLKYLLWNKAGLRGKVALLSLGSKLQQWKDRKVKNLVESERSEQEEDNSIRPRNDTLATMLASESAVPIETEDGHIISTKPFQMKEENKSYLI